VVRRVSVLLAAFPPVLALVLSLPHHNAKQSAFFSGLKSYATAGERRDQDGPSSYPSDWSWLRRTAPYWQADMNAFREALAQARSLKAASLTRRLHVTQLAPAGPENIGGRISDIEWNPSDINVLYAGAATGGVFKSTDGGLTWLPVADDVANLNVGDLAVDPLNPETVWLGTGEPNGGHNNFAGGGVYRSTNGGATWDFMGLGETVSIGRIVVDPTNSQRVFVAAQGSYFGPNPERGIYRTTNGGTSWQRVLFVSDSTAATDIAIDPSNPNRLIAAMWERVRRPNGGTHLFGATSRIWRSENGGDTWLPLGVANGLPDALQQRIGRIGLALCANDPDIAYAIITDGLNPIGLWRTTDFGTSWENRDTDSTIADGAASFSWYFSQVRVAPDNCNRVYAMDVTFFRSDDGGATFPVAYGPGDYPLLHVDHHALAFHPANPDFIFEGNDGGINYSSDRGTTWNKVARLPVTQFYEINIDPSDPARLYGGTQDNGTLRTTTGNTDDWEPIFGGDGMYVNVDPRDSDIIYAEAQFGVLGKTLDGGVTWRLARPPAQSDRRNWSTPVEIDPLNPNVIYYGSQRLWRSADSTASWSAVSGDLTDWVPGAVLGTITTIGVSPVDSTLVWVGTDDGNVWRGVRQPSGTFTWFDMTAANLPKRWLTRVVPHPTDPQSAWVTFNGLKWREREGHIFATNDGGATWTDVSGNLPEIPINALAVYPANPPVLFVGTDLGAYFSLDSGANWEYLSSDLPLVSVYDLVIHPVGHYLAIGTHGRSMYKLDLGSLTKVGSRPLVTQASLGQNFPNPFTPHTTITYTLAKPSHVRLIVYDAAGRRLRTLEDGVQGAGRHERLWNGVDDSGRPVRSGSYRYQLVLPGSETHSRRMVRIR
jgi:photosystem II stability/assembly factor-like uncharacterized protein